MNKNKKQACVFVFCLFATDVHCHRMQIPQIDEKSFLDDYYEVILIWLS